MSRDDFSSEGIVRPAVSSPHAHHGSSSLSLENVHSSVDVPHSQASFWEQWRAFVGPAILVSVGYMDPGNWGTDLQGGAQYKYGLLWVVGLASLMAIFMQVISSRLGVVTGKDLAQCCRDWYPRWTRWPNWLLCEIAIGACDLAEVLGSAVALNLMFHIPLLWAVIITGFDVLLLLALQRFGMRTIEAIVLLLVVTIATCYFIEIFVLPQTQPSFLEMGRALVSPTLSQAGRQPSCQGPIPTPPDGSGRHEILHRSPGEAHVRLHQPRCGLRRNLTGRHEDRVRRSRCQRHHIALGPACRFARGAAAPWD